jgi:hypothetical protein
MVQRPFRAELARGVKGEEALIAFLEQDGFTLQNWVQEEAVKLKKGPRLNGYVIPDILVSKADKFYWVDSKRKDAPIFYGKTKEWRHGIDGKAYRDYLAIQEMTAIEVWIAFHEPTISDYSDTYSSRHGCIIDIGGFWFVPIILPPINQDVFKGHYKDMVYWRRCDLHRGLL